MRVLKLTLSYDGTAYAGWQIQPDQRTLQETLEIALEKIVGKKTRTVASGRTDAGVHALEQVISFATECELSIDVLQKALNAHLPTDIAILEVREAAPGFHAIRDAIRKRYRYVIHDAAVRDVFARHYAWHLARRLDSEAMHRAAQNLVGTHDLRSFETTGSERLSSVRTISDIRVRRQEENNLSRIVIEVEADGFLYNMVRAIVGSLVEVGRGARGEGWLAEVVAAKDRRAAGMTAPPQGLFLVHVTYDDETPPVADLA